MADLSDITVSFVPSLNTESGYKIDYVYPIITSKTANFYKARITIATNKSAGEANSSSELYTTMVRAAGEAIGVHSQNQEQDGKSSKIITADDIAQVKALYRP